MVRRLPGAALPIAEAISLAIYFALDASAADWLTRAVGMLMQTFRLGIAVVSMMVLIHGPALARGLQNLDRGRGADSSAAARSPLIEWISEIAHHHDGVKRFKLPPSRRVHALLAVGRPSIERR